MEAAAERACRETGYTNAGTLEFLLGSDGAFYFIELNARLQVEHPVTELVTGHRHRPRAAADRGRRAADGHRSRAALGPRDRDPDQRGGPGSGTSRRHRAGSSGCALRAVPGVRLDTHVEAGSTIPPFYDSLIAKLVVWDADRPAAIARGLRALGELEIEGIATTRDFARDVLRSEAFVSGEYTTSYVDEQAAAR